MRSTKYGSFSATSSSAIATSSSGSLTLQLGQHFVTHLADDRRARIVVLVDAMAEAHQAETGFLVLGADRPRLATFFASPISLEHLQHGFVRAAVRRPHSAAMPAATHAYGLAPVEPTRRTVEVDAFCS